MKNKNFIPISIILLLLIISAYYYLKLPTKMATHWNFKGEVDGWSNKNNFMLLYIGLAIGLYLLFLIIPKIDPLANNIKKFIKYYWGLVIAVLLFLLYIYIITIMANLGYTINMAYIVLIPISALFYYIGILMKKAKRNWFVGIRNPWTLSSDKVWTKIHKLSSKIFKIYAIFTLFLLFLEKILTNYFLYLFLIPLLIIFIGLTILSYFEYKKEKK